MVSALNAGGAKRRVGAGAVTSMGFLVLAVPLFDIWQDVTALDWRVTATLAENAALLVLALSLVGGGIWLARCDWAADHVLTVAKWNVAGTALATVLFGWVLYIQVLAMHAPKPYIIALDGVLFASVATFAAGLYSAQTDRREAELQAERDRFAGLFQNTTDAIAAVAFTPGKGAVSRVNRAFEHTFGHDTTGVLDRAIDAMETDLSRETVIERAKDGETFEAQFDHETDEEVRKYLFQLVPHDAEGETTYLYFVITDVTDQQRLVREQAATERLETLHDFATTLAAMDAPADVYDLAADAVDDLLDATAMRLRIDGETVTDRTFNPDAEDTETVTEDVPGHGVLEVSGRAFDDHERTTVELLATHLCRTLDRLSHERALEAERAHMEFVNRVLRHNLLNDIQIVQGRLDLLDPESDSFEEHRDVIQQHVTDMAEFVETMRTYMKQLVEAETHILDPQNLGAVVEAEVEKARRSYPDAEISLDSLPDVTVDADDLLGPVFENLLANAVEHNDEDSPEVHISGERSDGEVTVSVRDNGPGIPDDRKREILERGSTGFESPGTGFGLYLVKQAVETYDGRIDVDDNHPKGAVFEITLPVAGETSEGAEGRHTTGR